MRKIDIYDQYPIESIIYKVKNNSQKLIKKYRIHLNKSIIKNLKYSIVFNNEEKELLFIKKKCKNTICFDIFFDKELNFKDFYVFRIDNLYEGVFKFKPEKIKIKEDQLIFYKEKYKITNYNIPKYYTITINCKDKPENISTNFNEVTTRSSYLSYTFETQEYKKIKNKSFFIHLVINKPFDKFINVEKIIELSHFGSIKINENFNIINDGAEIDGEFSRVDYSDHNSKVGKNVLRSLSCKLPFDMWNLSLKDENGLITNSIISKSKNYVDFTIIPRFPIFGKWKSTWFLKYNIISSNYLSFSKKQNFYKFEIPFSYSFETVLSEKYYLKILLPEYAKLVEIDIPYDFIVKSSKTVYKTLDFVGKEEISLEFNNIFPNFHNKNITVIYEYKQYYNLFKMIYCIIIVTIITGLILFISRNTFDFK